MLMLATVLFTRSFNAHANLTLVMTAEPAHPVIGDVVTWKVQVEGCEQGEPCSFAWNADPGEFPGLYNWTGTYPFLYAQSVTNVYYSVGDKVVSVIAYSGVEWVQRSLTVHVSEAEIKVTTPGADDIWYPGRTYEIKWSTRGQADMVQIGLFDSRYSSEIGNAGETLIAFKVPNTGHYLYQVPPPSPDGISAGNIGGRNYRVSVSGWNDCVTGFTKKFTITPQRRR